MKLRHFAIYGFTSVLIVLAALMVFGPEWAVRTLWSSQAAEWAQAIGTTAAVGAAIAMPRWIAREERRRYRNLALDLGSLMRSALNRWAVSAGRPVAGLDTMAEDREARRQDELQLTLTSLIAQADAVQVGRLESAAAAEAFLRLTGLLRSAADVGLVKGEPTSRADVVASWMTTLRLCADLGDARFEELARALSGDR